MPHITRWWFSTYSGEARLTSRQGLRHVLVDNVPTTVARDHCPEQIERANGPVPLVQLHLADAEGVGLSNRQTRLSLGGTLKKASHPFCLARRWRHELRHECQSLELAVSPDTIGSFGPFGREDLNTHTH